MFKAMGERMLGKISRQEEEKGGRGRGGGGGVEIE